MGTALPARDNSMMVSMPSIFGINTSVMIKSGRMVFSNCNQPVARQRDGVPIDRQHLDQWLAKLQSIVNNKNMGRARLVLDGLTRALCVEHSFIGEPIVVLEQPLGLVKPSGWLITMNRHGCTVCALTHIGLTSGQAYFTVGRF
jgi:hypothetical protein